MALIKKIFHLFIALGCTDMVYLVTPMRRKGKFINFCHWLVALVIGEKFANKVNMWFDEELETLAEQKTLENCKNKVINLNERMSEK